MGNGGVMKGGGGKPTKQKTKEKKQKKNLQIFRGSIAV
jgi:hypothetical protein